MERDRLFWLGIASGDRAASAQQAIALFATVSICRGRRWKHLPESDRSCRFYQVLRSPLERLTGVCHNTMINWVTDAANNLPSQPDYHEIPEVSQIDELQTYVGKKNKVWVWTVVNKSLPDIFAFVLGQRNSETFKPLWKIIRGWQCFFYVTDGYVVYPQFIDEGEHIVSKTYMTRA